MSRVRFFGVGIIKSAMPSKKPPGKSGKRSESSMLDPTAAAALALRATSSKSTSRPVKRPRVNAHTRDPQGSDVRLVDPNEGSVEQFERLSLGPLLWHRPVDDELPDIPTTFKDEHQYVKSFEPVLLEETREETRNAWCESIGEGRQFPLTFRSLRTINANSGWRVATFTSDDRRHLEIIKSLCPEHSVAILCVEKIQSRDPWPRHKECDAVPTATAGFVEKVNVREKLVEFKFFISSEVDAEVDNSSSNWKPWHTLVRHRERNVLEAFEGVHRVVRGRNTGKGKDAMRAAIENEKNGTIDLTEGGSTAKLDKEEGELVSSDPKRAEDHVWYIAPAGKLSSASQSYEALHHVRRLHKPMRDAMLSPRREWLPKTIDVTAPELAEEITQHPALCSFLESQFNTPQVNAIRWAAQHTLKESSYTSVGDNDEGFAEKSKEEQKPLNQFPFTLVQGPPGTGKTHTVWGILNILHFTLFQRYYQSKHRAIDLGTARETGDLSFVAEVTDKGMDQWIATGENDNSKDCVTNNPYDNTFSDSAFSGTSSIGAAVREMFQFLKSETGVEKGFQHGVWKPKILVCAPSNAAVDNLLERVLKKEFVKGDGGCYRPSVIRVGAADALVSEHVGGVTASSMVDTIMKMKPHAWDAAYRKQDAFQKEAVKHVKQLEKEHVGAAAWYANHISEMNMNRKPVVPATTANHFQQQDARVAEMLRLVDDRDKAVTEMARFAFCLKRLGGTGDDTGSTNTHTNPHNPNNPKPGNPNKKNPKLQNPKPGNNPQRQRDIRTVRNALEASFVDDAEIVFATLTSSSRRVFRDVDRGFDTVLIDEAAQANEIATLIPFLHGAKRCVLVGDPQQLPSTVLSQAAKVSNFQRSLFERFTKLGAEPVLLSVQYRMHPSIRAWPSLQFYDSRLQDSQSVLDREANDQQVYQGVGANSHGSVANSLNFPYFAPYVVFDVSEGSSRKNQSGSLSNPEEALFVVCLYMTMTKAVDQGNALNPNPGKNPKPSCAIITPYRQQRTCILKAFAQLFDGDGAAGRLGVRVSTIDGFQGQEADLVILSTVRGSAGAGSNSGGVGFLADIRRMNVALTRAKRALWICGNLQTLKRSDAWSGLVNDARSRNSVVTNAEAYDIFANVVPVEKQNRVLTACGGEGESSGARRGNAGKKQHSVFASGWGRGQSVSAVPPPPAPGQKNAVDSAQQGLDMYGDV